MATSNDTPSSSSKPPSFFARIGLAFRAFSAVLGDPGTAARLLDEPAGATAAPVAPPAPATPAAPATTLKQASPDSALQLLSLLQRDARLIDFAGENLADYSDAQVGAAARLVHEGCAKVLREHFQIVPVREEPEGSRVALAAGFDAAAVRLTGNVVGQPPFNGSLRHRGWRVAEVRLPQVAEGHDTRVLAAAEVEL
ncbi:DUF2760 domain-containing protein [Ramlibacter alkalitolerans]|uniref:DUF2760 domain-containing protein n=1 Tax=Ramlibacter alkalitolerans TaxID=2039631 RepID=A0ABS1JLW6_9BURK|nr:DUF2760 domain-containing protein [Ramlibacter alkalitolerans]MBL0425228.1 DUF2760 domain-containing protein [Ramlibacter alkalitolerans]